MIQRKLATKEACELILDNAPKEAEPEVKLKEDKIEREAVGKIGNGRCVEALRSRGRSAQKDSKKKETEKGGMKKKQIDHQ